MFRWSCSRVGRVRSASASSASPPSARSSVARSRLVSASRSGSRFRSRPRSSGLVAAVIGIPALRLKGLFLAVVDAGVFDRRRHRSLFDDQLLRMDPAGVDRPADAVLPRTSTKTGPCTTWPCSACVLAIVITLNLRRSRFGRLLIAMRENEANVQSFGVSAVRLKLTAFAVSGALAGFAGAVFVHQQRGLSARFVLRRAQRERLRLHRARRHRFGRRRAPRLAVRQPAHATSCRRTTSCGSRSVRYSRAAARCSCCSSRPRA